jgi:hypothetical protein
MQLNHEIHEKHERNPVLNAFPRSEIRSPFGESILMRMNGTPALCFVCFVYFVVNSSESLRLK